MTALHLRVQFDDLRSFDVAVFQHAGRKHVDWFFTERCGLNRTAGSRSSTKRYRTIQGALAECMSALTAYHEGTERP